MSKYEQFIDSIKHPQIIIYDYYVSLNCCDEVLHCELDEFNLSFNASFNKRFDEALHDLSISLEAKTRNEQNTLKQKINTDLFIAKNFIRIDKKEIYSRIKKENIIIRTYVHDNIKISKELEDFDSASWANDKFLSPVFELMSNTINKFICYTKDFEVSLQEEEKEIMIETFEELIPNDNHRFYILDYLSERELCSSNGTWLGKKEQLSSLLRHYLIFKDYYKKDKQITDLTLLKVAENSFNTKISKRSFRYGSENRTNYKEDFDSLVSAKTASAK